VLASLPQRGECEEEESARHERRKRPVKAVHHGAVVDLKVVGSMSSHGMLMFNFRGVRECLQQSVWRILAFVQGGGIEHANVGFNSRHA